MVKTVDWIRTADPANPTGASAFVHGERCRETRGLFVEWARALGFAAHFGNNWDAFADSLTEATLLSPDTDSGGRPTTVRVDQAGQLLADEPDAQWAAFLGAVRDVSTVHADDEDAARYRGGSPRLVLILRDAPGRLGQITDRLATLGYAPATDR